MLPYSSLIKSLLKITEIGYKKGFCWFLLQGNLSNKKITYLGGGGKLNWINDGFCDDMNNNAACTYDGGDCCGVNVNRKYCLECTCKSNH